MTLSSSPGAAERDRVAAAQLPARTPRRRLWLAAGVALLVSAGLGITIGAVAVPLSALLPSIGLGWVPGASAALDLYHTIVWDLRLPRVMLMGLTGAALAMAGTTYQGLFRNPLADPYLAGVASGAGLGATLVITAGLPSGVLHLMAVPVGAFLGGLAAVIVVVLIAQVGRSMPVTTLLLAGVAVGSFTTAINTFWMLRSPEGLSRAFGWMLGGYAGGGWTPVWVVLPYVVLGWGLVQFNARSLNVLQLEEEQARQLGLDVERLKLLLVGAATLMTAAAVAFGGLIGFVGLVVPHILRLLGGPDYRRLVPLAALGGAAFLIFADLLARTLLAPREIPVGIITALTGAPFFVYLLRRLKRSVF